MHVSQPIRRLMQGNIHTFLGFSFLLQHSHMTNLNPNPSGGDHEVKGRVVEQNTVNLLMAWRINLQSMSLSKRTHSVFYRCSVIHRARPSEKQHWLQIWFTIPSAITLVLALNMTFDAMNTSTSVWEITTKYTTVDIRGTFHAFLHVIVVMLWNFKICLSQQLSFLKAS